MTAIYQQSDLLGSRVAEDDKGEREVVYSGVRGMSARGSRQSRYVVSYICIEVVVLVAVYYYIVAASGSLSRGRNRETSLARSHGVTSNRLSVLNTWTPHSAYTVNIFILYRVCVCIIVLRQIDEKRAMPPCFTYIRLNLFLS